jgi:hypothetical protein
MAARGTALRENRWLFFGEKTAVSVFRWPIDLFFSVKTSGIFATICVPPRALFLSGPDKKLQWSRSEFESLHSSECSAKIADLSGGLTLELSALYGAL